MSENDMTLGRYLEAARQDAGLSLRQLAEAADVQLTIVARLMRDEVKKPAPAVLMRLAPVLELRTSDLFLVAGLPTPTDLPSVEALLRAEYDLPEDAVAEAKQQIEAIVARYKATGSNREEGNHGTSKHH
ncbi:helix-turn-helix domain-containing protein [Nocardioides sp. TRM66260-LWL]|uniref:helix-turn-helix domain-containing protein n=1 Tax=Nocardioides sp. TRM66260-LWL TaxID=2874478 RepID=UPI001CC6D176|nr:helix-turn-helix domain-containing protein [Nocardioides sp. TRM66260-LWL]MBZ5735123.1 helix-turn-helix domain-containing protein [Nocardioides sp. TRM66260-LWL]